MCPMNIAGEKPVGSIPKGIQVKGGNTANREKRRLQQRGGVEAKKPPVSGKAVGLWDEGEHQTCLRIPSGWKFCNPLPVEDEV